MSTSRLHAGQMLESFIATGSGAVV